MELSRRFRALQLCPSLRFHGVQAFREAIRLNLHQAQGLAAAVKSRAELELVGPTELSVVCFRHLVSDQATENERNQFNLALLKKLIGRGKVYLLNAELNREIKAPVSSGAGYRRNFSHSACLPCPATTAQLCAR